MKKPSFHEEELVIEEKTIKGKKDKKGGKKDKKKIKKGGKTSPEPTQIGDGNK